MPLIDKPLEELYRYAGSSPRPDDVDDYWDRALAEMRAVDPQLELIPADFESPVADCYDMYFTGVGGARVYAKLLKPKHGDQPHPAIVEFHGYTGDSGDWTSKLPYVAMGYTVASLDCRGQGGKSRDVGGVGINTHHGHIIRGVDDGPEHLLYRSIFLDTAQLTYLVMDMADVDADRVGCMGGSQGGALTLACASLVPEMKLAAPVFPFLCDYQRVWDMDLDLGAYAEIREYFRRFDPTHARKEAFFKTLAYIDVANMVHRIRAEVLMYTGLMDDICPPSTQFAAYNRIQSDKNVVIYPDFGHEHLPGQTDRTYQFMTRL